MHNRKNSIELINIRQEEWIWNVNEFLIVSFSADVFNVFNHDFYRLARGMHWCEETEESQYKDFIMALTIDLHRPLLALGGVSVASLSLERSFYTIYEDPSNYLFPHRRAGTSLFINGSNQMIKQDIFGIKENLWRLCGVQVQISYFSEKIKWILFYKRFL